MLREPSHTTDTEDRDETRDPISLDAPIPVHRRGGAVPPVLHDAQTPPGQRTASETAYADAPEPVKLPGRMYTVTLYDKRGSQIGKTLTEPLYEDIDGDLFYGTV